MGLRHHLQGGCPEHQSDRGVAMTAPIRIQRRRTAGWHMPPNTVYVGRGTPFGSPFPVARGTSTSCGVSKTIWVVGTFDGPAMWVRDSRDEAQRIAVDAYRAWVFQQPEILEMIWRDLRGKNLACWCPLDRPCHADVLLELANEETRP
jgi:hypothetical protein